MVRRSSMSAARPRRAARRSRPGRPNCIKGRNSEIRGNCRLIRSFRSGLALKPGRGDCGRHPPVQTRAPGPARSPLRRVSRRAPRARAR
ncbi:hypothetical protein ACFFX0_13335 [Citricoccus parietis]|uniref:Uncharacterized protein n=1 Tax=Citricoccus parietis TaxID=592307 RepID=A0ABV5FZN2_9MICC